MMEILYKKKVIRDFLSLYTDSFWTRLVSHLLEFGIIEFKRKHNISSMSPDDIFQSIEKFKKELGIYDSKTKERRVSKKLKDKSKNKLNRSRSGSVNSTNQDMSFSGKAGSCSRIDNKSKTKRKPPTSKDSTQRKSQTPNKDRAAFKFTHNLKPKTLSTVDTAPKLNKTNSNSNINHNISFHSNHSKIRLNTTESAQEKERENKNSRKSTGNNKNALGQTLMKPGKSKEKPSMKETSKDSKSAHSIQSINPNKLITFDNKDDTQSKPKAKPESRIKSLLENDKKKFQEMKHSSQVVTDKFNSTGINQDVPQKIQKETSIISLEDKLNGLTQKLSKINSSIDSYNNCFPYLAQHKETNENNDEDYLGEDQIDLNNNKSEDETEQRYYRKIDSDD